MAKFLDLSTQQKTQLNDIIERADAGAAVLIKREHDVKEMLVKTPSQDPLYAQLRAEQSAAPGRWQANRDNLHQEIRAMLTPAQQAKYEQLKSARTTVSRSEPIAPSPDGTRFFRSYACRFHHHTAPNTATMINEEISLMIVPNIIPQALTPTSVERNTLRPR